MSVANKNPWRNFAFNFAKTEMVFHESLCDIGNYRTGSILVRLCAKSIVVRNTGANLRIYIEGPLR